MVGRAAAEAAMSHPRLICTCGVVLYVCPLDHEPEAGIVKRWAACRDCWEKQIEEARADWEKAGPPPWPKPCDLSKK